MTADRYASLGTETLLAMLHTHAQTLRRPSLTDARRVWAEQEKTRITAILRERGVQS